MDHFPFYDLFIELAAILTRTYSRIASNGVLSYRIWDDGRVMWRFDMSHCRDEDIAKTNTDNWLASIQWNSGGRCTATFRPCQLH